MDDLNRKNNNIEEMSGEAALVVAARGGQRSVLHQLLAPSLHPPPSLSQQAAALYAASRAGRLDAVKCLIDFGTNVDVGIPESPLIGALIGGYADVAMLLIHYGADCDIKDSRGNSCLHLACASGLYTVVRALCALGCVQGPNLRGHYPLHVAARNGHIQVVRLLCFYGCKLDQRNGDGIRADITAVKYGHNDIAELLDRLRAGGLSTLSLRGQLLPGGRPLARPQVRLMGHSGSGKTALAASLNAGLLHALFRRSTSLTSRSRPSSPCQTSQIEMDITPRHNSLSFDSCTMPNYTPTKGVEVHQMDLNGVGDITVWDFSGQESYFQIYHHFLSDVLIPPPSSVFNNMIAKKSFKKFNSNELAKYTAANDNVITNIGKSVADANLAASLGYSNSAYVSNLTFNKNKYSHMTVYVVMFSLEKPYNVQLQQCTFWLNFIISKMSACNVAGGLGNVILVGSHADIGAHKTLQGDYVYTAGENLLHDIRQMFSEFFRIHHQVLALDCNASTSVGMRALKSYFASIKRSITQVSVGNWSGFLEGTLAWVGSVRKSIETFPVMDRKVFMDNVRCHVNLLASDEHITDIIHHLHIMGEILAVGRVIVLCCEWVGRVMGALLGRGGLQGARVLGVYTAHDFQAHFGYCDASQLLGLLQEMRLCTMCEVDDEIEYEFPCFNLVETLDGLWDPDDPRYQAADSCYGGLRLCQSRGLTHLISTVFPHIQVELRDDVESLRISDTFGGWGGDCDLYQWWHGSKLCWGNTECLVTLCGPTGLEYIDLKVRGVPSSGSTCFGHLERVLMCMKQAIGRVAPGLLLQRSSLSAHQLRTHCDEPYCWSTSQLINEMLHNHDNDNLASVAMANPFTGKKETLQSLLCFDSSAVGESLVWGPRISVRDIGENLLARLASLLDPPHELGAHWCMLAVSLGVNQDSIAAFDSEADVWHTLKLFSAVNCNVGTLIEKLENLGRLDATELILNLAPVYMTSNHKNSETAFFTIDDDKFLAGATSQDYAAPSCKNIGSRIHTDV